MDQALKKNVNNYPVCLMFQDEARFGRMSDPRKCWAPEGIRPLVMLALVRQFKYVFGAVCPSNGHFDYMIANDMRTPNMSRFLRQVSRAHPKQFVIMVLDGASTHKSKDLKIPSNVALIILPPYSPELNPSERVWNVLRRDYVANRYFPTLDEAIEQVVSGLRELKRKKAYLKDLTCWDWIQGILNAT